MRPSRSQRPESGFTLIEVMIVVAVVAILAAIALPSYQSYILKSRAQSATADLVGLSLVLENRFQKTLSYPVDYGTSTVVTELAGWRPSQDKWFTYSIVSTANSYTVTAAGKASMACTLGLNDKNIRTVSGAACGFSQW